MILTYEFRDISRAIQGRTWSLPGRFSGSTRCRMIRPLYCYSVLNDKVTCLPVHLLNSCVHGCNITGCMGKRNCNVIAAIFCIRHIDINNTIKQPQGIDCIISATIIDNWDSKALVCSNLYCFHHLGNDMGRCHDIDVMATPVLQAGSSFQPDLHRTFHYHVRTG